MANRLQIKLLADYPEAITVFTEWFEREWAPYYGTNGPGDAREDLMECLNRKQLPIAFVALLGDEVCGTAALKTESISTHRHLTPWLAALFVAPTFRRRGVGKQLIAAVEEKAFQFGFDCIYVGIGRGSGTPESTLRRRSWEFIEKTPYFVTEVSILIKRLS